MTTLRPGDPWLVWPTVDSFLGIVCDGLRTCGQLLGPRRPRRGGGCCRIEVTQIGDFLGGRKSCILIWSVITKGSMWSAKEFERDTKITWKCLCRLPICFSDIRSE